MFIPLLVLEGYESWTGGWLVVKGPGASHCMYGYVARDGNGLLLSYSLLCAAADSGFLPFFEIPLHLFLLQPAQTEQRGRPHGQGIDRREWLLEFCRGWLLRYKLC